MSLDRSQYSPIGRKIETHYLERGVDGAQRRNESSVVSICMLRANAPLELHAYSGRVKAV